MTTIRSYRYGRVFPFSLRLYREYYYANRINYDIDYGAVGILPNVSASGKSEIANRIFSLARRANILRNKCRTIFVNGLEINTGRINCQFYEGEFILT